MAWAIFYKQRTEIIEQVKKKELNPNVNWNGWICELPYEFPVVSHSGNDIGIYRNDKSKGITVTFWTYRNFFSAPSTCFVYSDNSDDMKEFERQIADDPEHNWKIKENWHRTFGE